MIWRRLYLDQVDRPERPDVSEHLEKTTKPYQGITIGMLNLNSLPKLRKLKTMTHILDKHQISLPAQQEMENTTEKPFESQNHRIYNGISQQTPSCDRITTI